MTTVNVRDPGLALPGSPAYDAATAVFNLAAPAEPAAALTARTVDEVRGAIGHAAATGRRVRVHATGHASAAVRPMRGSVLIRTRLDGGVEVDVRRRVARVPAGTLWGEVVEAAARHGLAAPHGSSATVGVVGYLLRGGLSFYGRAVGLAVNRVRAIELVTADGEHRRTDATLDPELFWALRGGGGGFGVVTAVEVELFPADLVITGAAFWPAAHARRVLDLWRRWTLDAPPEATTSLRVMNLPPLPGVPPALAAGPVVCVDGAILAARGPAAARSVAEDLLGPLRSVAEPVLDTWQEATPAAVPGVHMDPADPVPVVGDHMLLDELGDDGAEAFLGAVGPGSGSPLVVAGLRQLGGAFAVPDPAGGALNHLPARYSYAGSGPPLGPVTPQALRDHCAKVRAALSPWDTGTTVPSFVESFDQPQGHLGHDEVRRADLVRLRVDPDGLFRDDIAPGATTLR
ncbi:FAD-binding protein [Microbispora sp. ZYX-F-249]|uniref:FAD-binding protein n=1 Tax=Microbispora maris TaxID=3144104 RepID=A0ABV0B0R9_9ACTN